MKCVCRNEMTDHPWEHRWVCHRCGRFETYPTNTNYDMIMDMDEDRLAEFIYHVMHNIEKACNINEVRFWLDDMREE